MQVKQYIKSVASVVLGPVIKSLSNAYPKWGAGWSMLSGNRFSWLVSGSEAYNNKIFYSGVNILVRKLTEVPITFSKAKGSAISSRKIDKLYSKSLSNERRAHLKAVTLQELPDEHPLNMLFDNPNSFQSRIELMKDFWYNHALGDGFLYFPGLGGLSRDKMPKTCYSLSRFRVNPVQSSDKFNPIAYYEYTALDGTMLRIEPSEMLHLKQWNPNLGQLKGLGVDVVASMDIALNNANNTAQGAGYVNGGRGVAFSSKVDVNSTTGKVAGKMTVEQIQKIEKTVQEDMSGAMNNQRRVFTNGELVVTPYGDTIAEMELIKAEENNWKSIFALLGIPWSLAPITTAATDNNIAAGYKALVTNLIISLLREFDSKLTKLARTWEAGVVAMHDLTEFTELAPDLERMAKIYGRPPVTVNEHRSVFGHDELADKEIGEAILVASGQIRIQDLVNDFEDPSLQEQPERL